MWKKNKEGYSDPTASEAISNASKEEKQVQNLVRVIRKIATLAGFEVVGRIEFEHKKPGRRYK